MKTLNSFLILTFVPLMCGTALAGGSDRGGGNAVVCFKSPSSSADILNPANPLRGYILDKHLPDIKSVTAYDLAGMTAPVFPSIPGESHSQYIERVALRFEKLLPDLSYFLRNVAEGIADENITPKSSPLYRMYDENDAGPMNPESCVISTMAVQADVGAETQLTIDDRLFEHATHSELSKHVLFLHEYIYRFLRRRFDDKDSQRTRAIVQIVLEKNVHLDKLQAKMRSFLPYYSEGNLYVIPAQSPMDRAISNAFSNPGLWEDIRRVSEATRVQLLPLVKELDGIVEGNMFLKQFATELEKTIDHDPRLDLAAWDSALDTLQNFASSGLDHEPNRMRFKTLIKSIHEHLVSNVGENIRPKLTMMAKSGAAHLPLSEPHRQLFARGLSEMPSKLLYCTRSGVKDLERVHCPKYSDNEKFFRSIIQKLGIKL